MQKFAFELAKSQGRKKVTSATKSNGISITMPFWDERFNIIKNELKGSHFLATEKIYNYLVDSLKIEKGIAIPKYMLFARNGDLLDGDLPRPSSGDVLLRTIKKHLTIK